MCFYFRIPNKQELPIQIGGHVISDNSFTFGDINGFEFPKIPILTNIHPSQIITGQWGLIPEWSQNNGIANKTLNAKIETIKNKVSFRDYIENRCLIFASGFYEWQWLDTKGKRKQKYFIRLKGQNIFTFAGLYSIWRNHPTVTMLTTKANELMAEIHNTKKRMPIILNQGEEQAWLHNSSIETFQKTVVSLTAELVHDEGSQLNLF